MTPRRAATGLAGVLLVDKPAGCTSHDVVATIRRATGERRIGHAGTLDPMATGLLLVLVGPAVRLVRYLTGCDKRYDARITFGLVTDTLDAEGSVLTHAHVPEEVLDPAHARDVLAGFLGPSSQVPPAYSAIKTAGVAAHRRARAGEDVALDPRPIVVHEARLTSIDASAPAWDVTFSVSKGTYIRALARDIGRAAHTEAHLSALRRTAIGSATVGQAHTLDAVVNAAHDGAVETLFADPAALLGIPVREVAPADVADGRALPDDPTLPDGARVACVTRDELLAVYRRDQDVLRAETVFATGVRR